MPDLRVGRADLLFTGAKELLYPHYLPKTGKIYLQA
ncbi:hypothetical protein POKO110462_07485 [Pontibacter korlensis]